MTSSSPIHSELELVRAKEADDAFAFRFTRQQYLVRGRRGAYETAELPWSRELLHELEQCRRPDRDPDVVARVGNLLREFVGSAGWGGHEAAIIDARASRRRVHLTIRSAAAELYALPWELLTLRADGQHLGALEHVLLRYAWPGTSTVSAGSVDGRGRLLVAWSAAGGGIPAAEQTAAIEEATREAGGELEILEHASYGAIADALEHAEDEGRPFRGLHLLCHGAEAGSTFGLSLDAEGGEGRPVVVDAGRLQQLLAPYAHDLRLVVVAACDGGNMGEPGNRIGSVAQRLHRAGLQCVIASRYPLSARGSTRIARALYGELWQGETVERAFVAARSAAAREVTRLDWASLQLYARPEDGDANAVLLPPSARRLVPAEPAPSVISTEAAPIVAIEEPPPRRRSIPLLAIGLVLVMLGGVGVFLLAMDSDDPAAAAAAPSSVAVAQEPSSPIAAGGGGTQASTTAAGDSDGSDDSDAQTADTGEAGTTGAPTESKSRPRPAPTKSAPTKPAPTKPSRTRPTQRCGRALQEQVNDALPAPPSGRYAIEIWIWEDGRTKLARCADCADAESRAKSGLTRLTADRLTADFGRELPCRMSFEWQ